MGGPPKFSTSGQWPVQRICILSPQEPRTVEEESSASVLLTALRSWWKKFFHLQARLLECDMHSGLGRAWVRVPTFSQNPSYGLPLRGPVLDGQLMQAPPIALEHPQLCKCWWLPNYPNGCQAAHGWKSSLASQYGTPTWQLPPAPGSGHLSHHQGLLAWIPPHISEMVISCLCPGMKLHLGRHPRGPGAGGTLPSFLLWLGRTPLMPEGIPSLNPISPGGFSPQSPHHRGSSWATCEAGTLHYKLPLSGPMMSLDQWQCPWLKVLLLDPVWGRVLICQPWQVPLSHSFLPWATAWQNILWRMNAWWSLPCPHLWCLSKKALASNHHSASHTDTPSFSASLLAAAVFAIQFSWFKLSRAW